jgi:predicted nucleotidyltransferase
MIVEKDFLDFLRLLNKHKVEHLVIGGYALMAHDSPRYTGDLDIWVNPTDQNAERTVQAIDEFGLGSLHVTKEDFLTKQYIVQIGYEPVRIDISSDISGVTFDEAYPNRKIIEIEGIDVPFIGVRDLVKNKLASGRDQDLVDVKKLRRKLKE